MKRIITLLLSALMVVTLGTANVFGDGNVAKIGDNEYPTLADAVSAVQDGETITMLQSISDVDTGLPSNKNYTLDLNKKTISFKPTGYLLSEVGTKNIIIKNGTITVDGSNLPKYSSSCEYLIGLTNSNGSLTFDGADITFDGITNPNGGNDYFIFNFDDGIINFNNSKLTVKNSAQVFYAINNQKGTIDAKNSEFTFDKISDVIFHCDKVTSDNCTITSTDSANASVFAHSSLVAKNGSVVTIDESYPPFYGGKDCHGENFTVDSTSQVVTTNSNEWGINFGNVTIVKEAEVWFDEKVTIKNVANIGAGYFKNGIAKADGATISLTGGYYNDDVTDYCASGYVCVNTPDADPNHENYPYMVQAIEVAKIGDVIYPSLDDAIEAVEYNETITLLKDVTDASGIHVSDYKVFTIDFAGHTYTIKEAGTNTTSEGFVIDNGSQVIFKDGTIQLDSNNVSISTVIKNCGDMMLDNMRIIGINVVDDGGSERVITNKCGNVLITGGTSIIANNGDIALDSCKDSAFVYNAQVTINNANIAGNIEVDGGILYFKNGKLLGNIDKTGAASTLIEVTNGLFSDKVDDNFIVNGKACVANEDRNTNLAYPYTIGDKAYDDGNTKTDIGKDSNIVPEYSGDLEKANIAEKTLKELQVDLTPEVLTKAANINDNFIADAREKIGANPTEDIVITVVSFLDTKVLNADLDNTKNSTFKIDITPKYEIYGEKNGDDPVLLFEAKTLNVTREMYMRIDLPDGFGEVGDTVWVKHYLHDGSSKVYEAIIIIDGSGKYIEFLNPDGFSVFEFSLSELTPDPKPTPSHDDSSINGYKIPKTGIR